MKTSITFARYQCDRCPAQVDEYHDHYPDNWRQLYDYKIGHKYDFCPDCKDSYQQWVVGLPTTFNAILAQRAKLTEAIKTFEDKGGHETPFDKGWAAALLAIRGVIEEEDLKDK